MDFVKEIDKWVAETEKAIQSATGGLTRALSGVQRDLLTRLLTELAPKLQYKDGKLTTGSGNMARLTILERVWAGFEADKARAVTERFAKELMEVAGRNESYYLLAGFDEEKVKRIAEDTKLIRAKIGLNDKGEFLEGGYLDRLSKAPEVRGKILDYVVNSMASKVGPDKFAEGLRVLVQGAENVDGALLSHWKEYAFDSYSQVREIQNLHMADELKLNYFRYTGGTIDTTRRFCEKRNGKVFHRDETATWKDDADLIDPKTKDTYNPILERGRINCRHFIMWISDERAKELRPDIDG